MTSEHHITFPFQARYYQLGSINASTRTIVFALHGHGQLAQFFIRKFSGLDDGTTVIYAPEGLSRYYLEGFNGRVGATWMTREDRENDISNYINYLNAMYDEIIKELPENVRIHVIGFSQGAATATRWVLHGHMKIHRLILWAGILPYDMNIEKGREIFSSIEAVNVYGTKDPYLSEETTREMSSLDEKSGSRFKYVPFDGEHVIDEEELKRLFTPGEPS